MWVKKGLLSNRADLTEIKCFASDNEAALFTLFYALGRRITLLCLGAFHNDVEHCICNLVILDCLEQLFAVLPSTICMITTSASSSMEISAGINAR